MLAPSAVAAGGEIYTDAEGMKPHPTPQAMTGEDIRSTIAEYAQAAKNAVTARLTASNCTARTATCLNSSSVRTRISAPMSMAVR